MKNLYEYLVNEAKGKGKKIAGEWEKLWEYDGTFLIDYWMSLDIGNWYKTKCGWIPQVKCYMYMFEPWTALYLIIKEYNGEFRYGLLDEYNGEVCIPKGNSITYTKYDWQEDNGSKLATLDEWKKVHRDIWANLPTKEELWDMGFRYPDSNGLFQKLIDRGVIK